MKITKKTAGKGSALFLSASMLAGCGSGFVAPCNCTPTPTQPTQPTPPAASCNQDIVTATGDLNNPSLSPLDANGNPVPSAGVVNGSIATMIEACKLPAWDGTNPQNWEAGKEALTIYKPKGGDASFVDATTSNYVNFTSPTNDGVNFTAAPAIRVDNMDLPVTNGVVAVNSSAYDAHGDTGQDGAPFTAPLIVSTAELAKDAAFAAANSDVWNFATTYTANQLKYDQPMAIAMGQGYAKALLGDDTTAEALNVLSLIKQASGVDLNPTSGPVAFIPYSQYQAGNAPDGVFITWPDVFDQGINPTDGNPYAIQGSGYFNIFVKVTVNGVATYAYIDPFNDGDGRVSNNNGKDPFKGSTFIWGQPETGLSSTSLITLSQANAIAAAFGQTFTNAALIKPQFFNNAVTNENVVLAANDGMFQRGAFNKNAPAGKPAYQVTLSM